MLDADGRRYTVLFQSRLPALTMGWAAAPAGAGAMSLHVESPAGKQTFPSPTASRQLASGALAEGSYVWWYQTADGRTSPKTTVTIRFDNAAPTAQFFPKRSGAEPAAPGLVAVDGVTIDGAKVSAGGRSLTVDERGRFQGTVAPLSGDDAVIVRLEHPRTGIHYYVRHPDRGDRAGWPMRADGAGRLRGLMVVAMAMAIAGACGRVGYDPVAIIDAGAGAGGRGGSLGTGGSSGRGGAGGGSGGAGGSVTGVGGSAAGTGGSAAGVGGGTAGVGGRGTALPVASMAARPAWTGESSATADLRRPPVSLLRRPGRFRDRARRM